MDGILLRCYLHENQRYHSELAWEALLAHANSIGVTGGSAFRAMAGFGRHRVMHDGPRLFSLKATQTVEVEFLVSAQEADRLLDWARQEGLSLFYARVPARFDTTGPAVESGAAGRAQQPLKG